MPVDAAVPKMKGTRLSRRLNAIERETPMPPVSEGDPVSIAIATTAGDRLAAARLVGRLYSAEGYLGNDHRGDSPYFTLHHLLSEATVFVAREGSHIIGTLTVILDSGAGLPMESLYGEDVDALRNAGRSVCEICSLAIDPYREKRSSSLVLNLFKQAMSFLVYLTPVTDALITLKPSHAEFYGRRLGFSPMGGLKFDGRFSDAETVAMRLSREQVSRLAAGSVSLDRRERWLAEFYAQPGRSELEAIARAVPAKGLSIEELQGLLAAKKEMLAAARPGLKRRVADTVRNLAS